MNSSLLTVMAIALVAVVAFAGCKGPGCCSCDSACCSKNKSADHHHHADAVVVVDSWTSFEKTVLQATKPVIVDFNTTWCGACQELKPIFEKTAAAYADKYVFVSVNVSVVERAAKEFGIRGVPTIIFFKDGKEIGADKRIVGAPSEEQFKAAIEQTLGK